MADRMDTCASCRFWRRYEGGAGACRRKAPVLVDVRVNTSQPPEYQAAWPMMAGEEWCGDYELRWG